jgi:beta-lactamase class D
MKVIRINRELPVSERAVAMTSQITEVATMGGWDIHGKTGTGFPARDAFLAEFATRIAPLAR